MTKILIDADTVQQALEALEDAANILTSPMFGDAAAALRTAIAEAEKQEPVAWNSGVPPLYPEIKDGETISVEYVKATPPAAQRQPLTEEEIELLSIKYAPPIHPDFTEDDDFIEFARAIEAAHGITAAKGEA